MPDVKAPLQGTHGRSARRSCGAPTGYSQMVALVGPSYARRQLRSRLVIKLWTVVFLVFTTVKKTTKLYDTVLPRYARLYM